MRILWFNHRDPLHPQAGGAEVRIHEIGKRLVAKGYRVKLICERWKGAKRSDFLDGIEISRLAGKYFVHLSVPFWLNVVDDYDIVVDDVAHAVPWFSPLFAHTPVIGQVHHIHQEVLLLEMNYTIARFAAFAESALRYLYKTLIVVSESTRRDLIERFRIPEKRIRVVLNGVDPEFYRPARKSSQPTVLWVGRVKKYKRIEHLLLAFRFVERHFPDARLLIVGCGDYLETMREISKSLGVSNVVFMGRVDDQKKAALMASSWVIVSTSIAEGWGMTITESAACATPAVAYDVAGLRESVCDERTGFLVESGNVKSLSKAIVRVLDNERLRLQMSMNALEYSRGFSWDNSANEFSEVLEWTTNEE